MCVCVCIHIYYALEVMCVCIILWNWCACVCVVCHPSRRSQPTLDLILLNVTCSLCVCVCVLPSYQKEPGQIGPCTIKCHLQWCLWSGAGLLGDGFRFEVGLTASSAFHPHVDLWELNSADMCLEDHQSQESLGKAWLFPKQSE